MTYSPSISFGALLTLLLASFVNGLAISYCSSENTAGDFQTIYSQYQSNGLCQNACSDYAYAVLQGGNCWCSNYAPSEQVNTLDCNQQCPGYPDDWCGSTSAGLYGYYQLSVAPSGTAGGVTTTSSSSVSTSLSTPGSSSLFSSSSSSLSISSSSSSSSSSSTRSSSIVVPSVSSSASSRSATSSSSAYVAPSTSSSPQTPTTAQNSTPSPSTTNEPTQVYTSVMTVTGIVKTVVVTPTATGEPSSLGQGAFSSGGFSTGKVVGIVLGVALGLGLVIGLAVWFWLRRKHQNQSRASSRNGAYVAEDGDTSRTTPSRQVSQMSSSGLLGKVPRILTNGYGPGNNTNNPRSPDTASKVSSNGVDRRSLGTDQRLNPYAIYAHEEARMSSVSLQDNQDYSRQLRIANPD